jgi:hypothetical protein
MTRTTRRWKTANRQQPLATPFNQDGSPKSATGPFDQPQTEHRRANLHGHLAVGDFV